MLIQYTWCSTTASVFHLQLKADESKAEYVFCGSGLPLVPFGIFSSDILGNIIKYMKEGKIQNCTKGYTGLQDAH